jgi:cell division protease FtsH
MAVRRRLLNMSKDTEGIDERRDDLFEHGSPFALVHRGEIVGIDSIVARVDEIASYLRDAAHYERHGARLEAGVVFCGPPGTGKTLVARYLATMCGALFVNMHELPRSSASLSGADIADAFRRARAVYRERSRPVLLFWDELDADAPAYENAGTRERELVAQLRAELDGVAGRMYGVLLVGCTNQPIDHALMRPGRMSAIAFDAPDFAGKATLLRHALSAVACEGEIDAEELAHLCPARVPASEISESVADAWFRATRRAVAGSREPTLREADVRAVLLDRCIGEPPPWQQQPERLRVAVHELGHALVALGLGIPLTLVTVRAGCIGSGMVMLGEYPIETVEDQLARVAVGLGSTVAERCAGLGVGLGNSDDTARATANALSVVDGNGAGERSGFFNPHPLRHAGPYGNGRGVSQEVLERLDLDAADLLEEAHEVAERILDRVGRERLLELAAVLAERETLLRADISELLLPAVADELEPAWDT